MITALLLTRFALAAVFAVAGIAKLGDRAAFKKTLGDFGVPAVPAPLLAWLVPVAELVFAAALLPLTTAWWGACGVLAMLLAFCTAIGVNLARGRRPDCRCFGQIHSTPIGWKTLARNAVLSGAAVFVIWQSPDYPEASAGNFLGSLKGLELAVLGLAALAAVLFWILFHLLRQNGRLLLRVEAVEAKLGMHSPEPSPAGLAVNTEAPGFRLAALDGGTFTLDLLRETGKPVLLAFSEPDCTLCDKLLPELAQWQQEHGERLSIAIISRGNAEANRAKTAAHDLRNVLLQADREVAESYRVNGTPSAVLIRHGKIASSLAEGIDPIRALVRQAILPPPVKKGDRAPSLKLADLGGNTIDLARLRGRRTLLLFWNPSCGFCQKMLPDMKEWERNRSPDAPQLVVISAGSQQENREQGFRSMVLLDPGFSALHVFSAEGTPSGVLLDAEGTLVSKVGVGADEVFALAGAVPAR